jgi:hypothetical protein
MEIVNTTIINLFEKDTIGELDQSICIIFWLYEMKRFLTDSSEFTTPTPPIIEEEETEELDEKSLLAADDLVRFRILFKPPFELPRITYCIQYSHYVSMYENDYGGSIWSNRLEESLNRALRPLICDCDNNDCEICLNEESMRIHNKNIKMLMNRIRSDELNSRKRMQIMIFFCDYVMSYGLTRFLSPRYREMIDVFFEMLKFVYDRIRDPKLIKMIDELNEDAAEYYFY